MSDNIVPSDDGINIDLSESTRKSDGQQTVELQILNNIINFALLKDEEDKQLVIGIYKELFRKHKECKATLKKNNSIVNIQFENIDHVTKHDTDSLLWIHYIDDILRPRIHDVHFSKNILNISFETQMYHEVLKKQFISYEKQKTESKLKKRKKPSSTKMKQPISDNTFDDSEILHFDKKSKV